eukprot:03972.XXX_172130_172381_1 [CDS] Oithona nana genome sequencing.
MCHKKVGLFVQKSHVSHVDYLCSLDICLSCQDSSQEYIFHPYFRICQMMRSISLKKYFTNYGCHNVSCTTAVRWIHVLIPIFF